MEFFMKVKERILAEKGYASEKDLLKDLYLLEALAKVEQYQAECEFFEKKYGMDLKMFEQQLHKKRGIEDFGKEDNLNDWEFAHNALNWWKRKLKELRLAKDAG